MKQMKSQEEEHIIVKEAMKSNTPVTHVKAVSTQTKKQFLLVRVLKQTVKYIKTAEVKHGKQI